MLIHVEKHDDEQQDLEVAKNDKQHDIEVGALQYLICGG
jgi:hypothetical protein